MCNKTVTYLKVRVPSTHLTYRCDLPRFGIGRASL